MRNTSFSLACMSRVSTRNAGKVVLNECSTHFGLPVVPEVNAMRNTSLDDMATRSADGSGVVVASSLASDTVPSSPAPSTTQMKRRSGNSCISARTMPG
jgi:hypothetical protein